MFGSKEKTTDSIIQPLLKMVSDLETHASNQDEAATRCEEEIQNMITARDFKRFDVVAARKIVENVKSIVGG